MAREMHQFPIVEWQLTEAESKIAGYDDLVLSFTFFTEPMQDLEEARHSDGYVLTRAQAVQLRDALDRMLYGGQS